MNSHIITASWVLYMSTLLLTSDHCRADHLGHDVADALTTFANDGLGVQAFQDYLDNSITFIDEELNGTAIVKQIAEAMSSKLQIRIDALTGMRNAIESIYDNNQLSPSNPFQSCCEVDLQEKSTLLNIEVNYEKICTVGQGVNDASDFLSSSITSTVRTQYEKALGIKYAFFGSEEGVMFNYPAVRVCQNDYDPRYRPWYVETASPDPKDVVIVIDRSGSMNAGSGSQTLMEIAIAAAITVLETLNPNDRVGIVAFSSEASTPSGLFSTSTCYRDHLAKATAENKDYLKSYISGLSPDGQTFYNKALDAAFTYFDNDDMDDDGDNRDKVILFLTDGKHTETDAEDIYNKIALRNVDLKNEVVILTYGLGITDESTATVLENMAKQVKSGLGYGDITEGIYEAVSNPDNLRSAMASYYDQFLSGNQNIIFSVPYLDAFGTGLLISMCLPVTSGGDFKGVTCMDLAVDDLLADITYFREGETSYAFIIDEYGRVLTHPLLPNPSEITNNPLFIYISALETVAGIEDIRNSMIRGETGTASGLTRIVTSRGNVQLEGVLWTDKPAVYSWHPITGSGFSICLVVGQEDERTSIQWTGSYPDYIYHRLDLYNRLSTCRTFDRVAVRDRSTVMLAARAFEDPFRYLYDVETSNDVTEYETYLKGSTDFNPGFKEGVRETVAVTAKFEELMRSPQNNYDMYSVWRYVSTDNGVHRIYPGVQIPKNYDPTQRTWYLRAKVYKGSITVSTPYVDAFGAGIVVTLSQAIYEGKPTRQHTADDRAIAVMGVDFTLQYFYNLVTMSASSCDDNTCLVIDSAGFIVAHKDWIIPSKTTPETENVHVSEKEPYLANRLKALNLMTASACVNVEELRDQYFWKVSRTSLSDGSYTTSDFELHEVENTNIFLVILKRSFSASCDSCLSVYAPCVSDLDSSSCFCPCYSKADIYKYCLGEFDFSGDDNPPCTPPVPEVSFTDVNALDASQVGGLSECYDYRCEEESKRTDSDCNSVILCSWCEYDNSGLTLSNPYCSTTDVCPGGYLTSGGDSPTTTSEDGGDGGDNAGGGSSDNNGGNQGSQWWIAVVIIVALALAAVAGFFIYKKVTSQKKSDSQPQPPSARAVSGGNKQGFDNLAMVHTEGYSKPINHAVPQPPPMAYNVGGNMQGFDNKAMVHSEGGYSVPAENPNYNYLHPAPYTGNSTGVAYEVAQPQYESLNYEKMSQQQASAPYDVPPPAYGPAR